MEDIPVIKHNIITNSNINQTVATDTAITNTVESMATDIKFLSSAITSEEINKSATPEKASLDEPQANKRPKSPHVQIAVPPIVDTINNMKNKVDFNEHKSIFVPSFRVFIDKILLKAPIDPDDRFPKRAPNYPYPEPLSHYLQAAIGIFISISCFGLITKETSADLLIGSFGASVALFFAAPNTPGAQPKNAILSQIIAGYIGITIRNAITSSTFRWLSVAISCACSLTGMHIFRNIHPPAGATALITASFDTLPMWSGYKYMLTPIILGDFIMLGMALVFNNVLRTRHYPDYWS